MGLLVLVKQPLTCLETHLPAVLVGIKLPPVAVTECPKESNLRDFRFPLAHGLRVQEGESVGSWSQCLCSQETEGWTLLFP